MSSSGRRRLEPVTPGPTLDAGALVALERGERSMAALVVHARDARQPLCVPAAGLARIAGHLCGRSGTSDIVDAGVVVAARGRGHRVITSDPDDLHQLDPMLTLVVV